MLFLFYVVIILISNMLQTTNIINFFTLTGQIQPNFILLIVIYINIQEKDSEVGEGLGFAVGLLEDFLSIGLFGLNAFSKTIVSFIVNLSKNKFYVNHFIFAFLFVFFISLIHSFIYLGLQSILVGNISFRINFLQIALPSAVYNGLLAPFIFPFLKKIQNKIISLKKDKYDV